MKKKVYWIVAWKPNEFPTQVLLSSKKPYYLKSIGEWSTQTGDNDWAVTDCFLFRNEHTLYEGRFVTEDFSKPRKVEISINFK